MHYDKISNCSKSVKDQNILVFRLFDICLQEEIFPIIEQL